LQVISTQRSLSGCAAKLVEEKSQVTQS